MKYYYDLHIHSCLSPCGDDDMTPNNIVNMAALKGLDVIAVSDHNSCKNVRAVMKAAEGKITVIPAMEIETSEEVHVLTLFPDIASCEEMGRILNDNMPFMENRADIFGNQYIMDGEDNICSEEKNMLVRASELSVYRVFEIAGELGAAAVPAHIDRTSYSIISNLGFIPDDLFAPTVEITEKNLSGFRKQFENRNIITNSDAHYLENISEKRHYIELEDGLDNKLTKKIIQNLCKFS